MKQLSGFLCCIWVVVASAIDVPNGHFFPPGTSRSGNISNMVLTYLDARSIGLDPDPAFVFNSTAFEELISYQPAQATASYESAHHCEESHEVLFDAVQLIGYVWKDHKSFWPGLGPAPLNLTDWNEIFDLWMSMGVKNIEAAANATIKQKVKVTVTIPYPDRRQESFGECCEGSGSPMRNLNFSKNEDRQEAAQWWVRRTAQWFTNHSDVLRYAELAGFYWFLETYGEGDDIVLPAVADVIHNTSTYSSPLVFFWIPYYDAAVHVAWPWRSYGFDFITIQPNFAFNDVGVERFAKVNALMLNDTAGVEMELPLTVRNSHIHKNATTSFFDYLHAAKQYKWQKGAIKTYYLGNDFVIMANAVQGTAYAEMYAALHDFIRDGM